MFPKLNFECELVIYIYMYIYINIYIYIYIYIYIILPTLTLNYSLLTYIYHKLTFIIEDLDKFSILRKRLLKSVRWKATMHIFAFLQYRISHTNICPTQRVLLRFQFWSETSFLSFSHCALYTIIYFLCFFLKNIKISFFISNWFNTVDRQK